MSPISRLLSVVLLVLLTGCAAGSAGISGIKLARSQKERAIEPQVPSEDVDALSAGNTAFALDLYQQLGDEGNLFFSPYSISTALAMTYAGARGETETAVAQAMRFNLPPDKLHPAFNSVDQQLASRKNTGGEGADGKGFRLNLVNDLWGQQDYKFLPEFLDLLAENYGAGLRLVDFQQDSERSRELINDYIAEQTEQRIKNLIPAGAVTPATRLVLTNAVYFNAAWLEPFEEADTQDAPFTRLDGTVVDVPMMRRPGAERLVYAQGEGFQAVALPYENSDIMMWLLVPDEGQFASFESALDGEQLRSILADADSTLVYLRMPRWEIEQEFSLGQKLAALGMSPAFDPNAADFSGMDGGRNLFISDVVHKSFVKVDEAGTEAAAATAVIMEATAMQEEPVPVELTVDRPFLFFIYDRPTGTILFFGRVLDPLSK